ncbi:MAG: DUF167 domain-containing protein [Patescibacteria group bacterium]|nr:DUF167 domain-containing protein [Patescibacteria group bacterium]
MHIKIKVKTSSRTEKVEKRGKDAFTVSVREPAERGEANDRVIRLLRRRFPGRSVKLVSGHHKSSKIAEVS